MGRQMQQLIDQNAQIVEQNAQMAAQLAAQRQSAAQGPAQQEQPAESGLPEGESSAEQALTVRPPLNSIEFLLQNHWERHPDVPQTATEVGARSRTAQEVVTLGVEYLHLLEGWAADWPECSYLDLHNRKSNEQDEEPEQ